MAGQDRDEPVDTGETALRPPSPPSNLDSQISSALPSQSDSILPPVLAAGTLQLDFRMPGSAPQGPSPDQPTHLDQTLGPADGSRTNVQHFPLSQGQSQFAEWQGHPSPTGGSASPDPSGSGRRNIHFPQPETMESPSGHSRQGSWDGPETQGKSRGASFMSKLKALKPNPGLQSPKSPSTPVATSYFGSPIIPQSPNAARFAGRVPDTLAEEQSDADADVETADEGVAPEQAVTKKKKRRMRRFKKGHMATPSAPIRFNPGEAEGLGTYNRLLRRRASMPDTSAREQVLSDGEPRAATRRPFRRGHSYMNPSPRPPGEELDGLDSSAVIGRRNGHVRRITVFGGGGVSDGDAITPRRPFFHSDRASNFGAQKWKQVKNTLKLIRQRKEDRFDYFRSAELMAELRAGAPAVLMLASMIQRDEHGNKRIPVLLEQLRVTIKDSSPVPDDDKDRHWIFTIELEYGSGPSRMVWTVTRNIRDIYNLHFRYKFALNNDKYMLGRTDLGARPKQPKFPYSAFPYLRRARDKGDISDDEDQTSAQGDETAAETIAEEHNADGVMSGGEGTRQPTRKKSRTNLLGMRRRSTGITDPGEMSNVEATSNAAQDVLLRRQRYVEKQRRILEKYLSEMIRWLMFRADSNRLCRFLELSALGVRLAAEGSYHGKEGYLYIQSSKGLDFRRVLTPAKVIARHSRKWFLVRQSYIVCVESPENMNIYDVYLVDSKFSIVSKRNALKQIGSKGKQAEVDLTAENSSEKHHTLTLHTSERKVRLFSRYQSVTKQFEASITEMLKQTPWHEEKRFDSFAPVRHNVFAQWLVDGRDYMWNVSRAINMARDVIYIHDWWLSPELYMRRPACISQKWRLDRLLQKKAREGVKVFVIIYRNVEAAIPIDSEYTKFSLLNLHPNIFVQRSPNQFKKNQFFFAHHEKICIVDHDVAFVGGIDLCFGRWDSPQHPIVDDRPTGFEVSDQPRDAEHCQLFPGKDYSNPRVQDFFRLSEPYEEMYDRTKIPRMPWHDVAMQVVGQPARDLTRHFVQRWNYLRRGRKPTRPLPFLLPPPDAKPNELEALGLSGTCEIQILRSASTWSLGIDGTEHSIQTAYIKMIEDSEHYVYMENQFFITSTEAYNTKIVNRIGDALVDRIIRAHSNNETWRCTIVIPLMPGFQNTVDEQEGTSVRLIVMCQYQSICRGEHSIFGRLRAAGVDPEDYISFFSLRQWGVIGNDSLVTEQLYIHAKTIIVDDRVALIGSANINERSMLGTRDSECAAIVRDTDMIWTTMGGKPYQVGRFSHTLRLRLMREHLGLDVDEILEQERDEEAERGEFEQQMDEIYQENGQEQDASSRESVAETPPATEPLSIPPPLPSFNSHLDEETAMGHGGTGAVDFENADEGDVGAQMANKKKRALDVSGHGPDQWHNAAKSGHDEGRDSVIVDGREVLVHDIGTQGKGTLDVPKRSSRLESAGDARSPEPLGSDNEALPPMPPLDRRTTDQLGLLRPAQLPTLPVVDDTDIGGPPVHIDPESGRPTNGPFHPMAADVKMAQITKDCMRDPVDSSFLDDIWSRVAANNTKLYRRVFRCMPDSEVTTWAEYREYTDYGERFRRSMDGKSMGDDSELKRDSNHQASSTAAGIITPGPVAAANALENEAATLADKMNEKSADPIDETEATEKTGKPGAKDFSEFNEKQRLQSDDKAQYAQLQDGSVAAKNTHHKPEGTHLGNQNADASPGKFLDPQAKNRERRTTFSTLEKPTSKELSTAPSVPAGSVRRRRRANTKGSRRGFTIEDMPSRTDAEELLKMVQGNLVQFPYDWLLTEELNGNWGYQVDGVAPLAIYN